MFGLTNQRPWSSCKHLCTSHTYTSKYIFLLDNNKKSIHGGYCVVAYDLVNSTSKISLLYCNANCEIFHLKNNCRKKQRFKLKRRDLFKTFMNMVKIYFPRLIMSEYNLVYFDSTSRFSFR